jgi:hypothetical protein
MLYQGVVGIDTVLSNYWRVKRIPREGIIRVMETDFSVI